MTCIFGYRQVTETSCGSCGNNYMAMEQDDLGYRMLCWCGSTCRVEFDSDQERDAFIRKYQTASSLTDPPPVP